MSSISSPDTPSDTPRLFNGPYSYVWPNIGVNILALNMSECSLGYHQYDDLPNSSPGSFSIAELKPEKEGDPVTCLLHVTDWSNLPDNEALTYA